MIVEQALYAFGQMLVATGEHTWVEVALKFFPFALLLELPVFLLVVLGIVRYSIRQLRPHRQRERYPTVSCVITCYAEGNDVIQTIESLAWQEYPGTIEIIPVIDGAIQSAATLAAARSCAPALARLPRRRLLVLPKWQRGGRVSSLNAGLQLATGEVVMALDGDTSFDNDMVRNATRHFDDPEVVGVAGSLRVRNAAKSLATRLQALEYLLSIGAGKTGLSEFNLVNNISGAFGVFRAAFLRRIGGWDAGTAEDLDLTLRMKQYFGRHRHLRIVFEPHAIGHTDAPDTFTGLLKQRLRWEGDLYYLFVRKYRFNLRPRLLGWRNFVFTLLSGVYLQLVMPFVIVGYTGVLLWQFPPGAVLGVLAFVYLVYLAALAILFALYLIAISERPREDLPYLLLLPLFPLFALAARVHSSLAVLTEMFLKSHLDSAMAPWWVLRKTKF